MADIADLVVRLGADSSKLVAGLKDAKTSIDKTFDPKGLKDFQAAMDGLSGSMGTVIGKAVKFAALAGVDFHIMSSVKSAIESGKRLDELAATLGTTTAEASRFSKTMTLAGGDVQTASTAIMRLDKTISGTGEAADKANKVLEIFGVSLTDGNGKLRPVTEQMQALAEGFKKASDAGYGQEYLMETLGSRGLSLAGALNDYAEASKAAAQVKGIGLDPEQMKEIGLQLDMVSMQAKQFGLLVGSAMAPVISEILPTLMSGLQATAQYLSENKEEVANIIKYAIEFYTIYKSLAGFSAIGKGISFAERLFGRSEDVNKAIEQEEKLNSLQEASIAKRERMIENQAMQDEKRKLKEIQTMEATEAEKTAIFKRYCDQREAQAVQQSAAIRASMTQVYTSINASAVGSANVQRAALGQVTASAALASRGIGAVGTNAELAGARTIGAMGKATTVISNVGKMVWALAGGWLGVATAIGICIYKLYEFYKAERSKAANDPVYTYNGKKYQYDADSNVMVRLKDNGTRMNVYNQDEMNGAYQAALDQGLDTEAAKNKNNSIDESLAKAQEDYKKTVEDARRQMEELTASLKNGGAAVDSVGKAAGTAAPKLEKAPILKNVEVPIGEIAASLADSITTDQHGSQWLGPLTDDMENSCMSFVAQMWKDAGISDASLYSANGNDVDAAFVNKGAWHDAGGPYNPEPGDYVSGPKHVGMYIGNNMVASRDSSGGLQQHSLEEFRQMFGINGYGSIREYTGGMTSSRQLDEAAAAQEAALKKLQEAKQQAVQLFTSMQNEIEQQTGTTWSQGMEKIAQNIQAKQQKINELQNAGVPETAVEQLEKKLAEYRKVMVDQMEKKRKESLDKMVTDTEKANAELKGDYKSLADAEYESTVQALDREREERVKAVAKNKDDKESMAAVEDWYTAQVQAAAEKRTEAYRDSFEKQMKYSIQHQDISRFFGLMNSDEGKNFIDWESQNGGMEKYYSEWKCLQEDAHESMLSQVADVSAATENAFQDFFNSLVEGKETFGDAFADLVDSILESMVQQITDKWAAQITNALFGGMLNPGQNNGGDFGGNMLSGGMNTLFNAGIGSLFGGGLFSGGNSGAGNNGGDAVSTLMGSISKWTTGMDKASTATDLLTGSTTGLNKISGSYNAIQSIIATTTKPAEQGADVSATSAMWSLEMAAYSAAAALKAVGFGAGGFASGGAISGPGTGTSDSIPAFLSDGEFVVSASAVDRVGLPLLEAINSGRYPRFAAGGAVGIRTSGAVVTAALSGGNVTLNVSTMDAASFADFLQRSGGKAIKQFLLDTDRNYTGSSDVW